MTSRGICTKGVGITSSSRSLISVLSAIILSLRKESNSPELACVAWCVAWCGQGRWRRHGSVARRLRAGSGAPQPQPSLRHARG